MSSNHPWACEAQPCVAAVTTKICSLSSSATQLLQGLLSFIATACAPNLPGPRAHLYGLCKRAVSLAASYSLRENGALSWRQKWTASCSAQGKPQHLTLPNPLTSSLQTPRHTPHAKMFFSPKFLAMLVSRQILKYQVSWWPSSTGLCLGWNPPPATLPESRQNPDWPSSLT